MQIWESMVIGGIAQRRPLRFNGRPIKRTRDVDDLQANGEEFGQDIQYGVVDGARAPAAAEDQQRFSRGIELEMGDSGLARGGQ
jgi:hypothetical protein